MDVANAPILACIAPGPAQAVVEHCEMFARRKLADRLSVLIGPGQQRCGRSDHPVDRFGIMGCDHSAGERDVGKILAVGVELRVGML